MGKLLSAVLNNRLKNYVHDQNILHPAQIGFLPNHRTTDHISFLRILIDKYVTHTTKGKLYTCFVDFKKAFDSIWHDGLLYKLLKYKIGGNFYDLIKTLQNKMFHQTWPPKERIFFIMEMVSDKAVTETRTQEDLEKKNQEAVLENATTKQMITSLNKSLLEVHFQVLIKIKQAQKSARRLDEIALKPNPLSEVEYIELLIASESSTSPGWKECITYYDVVKRHTIRLSKVKDEKESKKLVWQLSTQAVDNIEEARKEVENLSLEKL